MATAGNLKQEYCVGNMPYDKASPAAVAHFLEGLTYPVSKDDIMLHALQSGAPADVLRVLSAFQEKIYQNTVDISREAGRVRY